jgi:hypothetical protein
MSQGNVSSHTLSFLFIDCSRRMSPEDEFLLPKILLLVEEQFAGR